MKIETPLFGEVEVQEEEIIHFPHGIPGFENMKRFMIIDLDDIPFSYLQCIDEPELSLLITDPFLFNKNYEFDLSESARAELEVKDVGEVIVRVVVSVKDDLQDATMNLLAPMVINTNKKIGKQVVLHLTPYSTRQRLIHETEELLNTPHIGLGG